MGICVLSARGCSTSSLSALNFYCASRAAEPSTWKIPSQGTLSTTAISMTSNKGRPTLQPAWEFNAVGGKALIGWPARHLTNLEEFGGIKFVPVVREHIPEEEIFKWRPEWWDVDRQVKNLGRSISSQVNHLRKEKSLLGSLELHYVGELSWRDLKRLRV